MHISGLLNSYVTNIKPANTNNTAYNMLSPNIITASIFSYMM